MPRKREPKVSRIYIRNRAIALSMYKRHKEFQFTTVDLMRMHWDRQGARALNWAACRIKALRRDGLIETLPKTAAEHAPRGDTRARWYRFTEEALRQWNLYDQKAHEHVSSITDTWKKSNTGEATNESSSPPE